ncbi:putative adipose-regulatory protein-domain-containing protein [Coniochaeta sp. 2T2.1]|nr:putative adipose-regulatory protein-domain-containing protein [Coniochaeta sp. 2T2.1]
MSALEFDTMDTTNPGEMWAHASEPDTPANDVPTGSSHMPAPATEHNSNNNHNFNSHDAVPRIYLSSRVAEDHTATAETSPSPTPSAKMDILNQAYATLTSKTAQRTLLNTVLLTTFSTILYGLAALVYVASYNAYLPDQITTLPLHLQYNYGANPYAVSTLENMKPHQAYDVSLALTLPPSPANVDRDNFMVALYLLDKPGTAAVPPPSPEEQQLTPNPLGHRTFILSPPDPTSYLASRRILHASHRPALVPYTDPLVSLASRLFYLPASLLSSSGASSTTLSLSLVEKLAFPTKGSPATPSSLFIELQAGQSLRVASASVTVTAQLSGLRWLMYHHWLSSFLAGTALFWGCEVVAMGVAWAVLSSVLFSSPDEKKQPGKIADGKTGGKIREFGEGEQMSDTERTFPTTSRAPPLKYESQGERVVKEEDLGGLDMAELPVTKGEAADDEDDEVGEGWRDRDSGIGTSYSDAAGGGGKGTGGVRRRTSGKGK